MKTKGIPVWERYIEYIVLLIAVLLFIGFAAMQFVGNPNAVTTAGRDVGPGEVDDMLREEAERLNSRLVQGAPAPITIPEPEPMADSFIAALDDPISPVEQIVAFIPAARPDDGTVVDEGGRLFNVPDVPPPHTVVARQYFDGLTPEVVFDDANRELATIVGEAPYDISWITPAAVFDLSEALARLTRDDPANDRYAVPTSWYRDRVTILDVRVERQERTDGGWGGAVTLAPIPGQETLRPQLQEKIDAAMRDEILALLAKAGNQAKVVQPPFYETRNNAFDPPDPDAQKKLAEMEAAPVADEDPEAEELRRLRFQRDRFTRQRDSLQAWVDENCANISGPAGGGGPGGGRAGGGASGGGRGAPGSGGFGLGAQSGRRGSGLSETERKALVARCERQRSQIERLERDLERVNAQLLARGEQMLAEEPEPAGDLMDADEIVVWAHDLTVEVGKIYRYRFTIDVYNPFFARKISLMPEQHGLAESISIETVPSEWSDPIEVDPPLKFFITAARAPSDAGIGASSFGQATVELFRFFDGRWWGDDYRFTPGERIAGASGDGPEKVEFATPWFILDIAAIPDRENEQYAGQVMLQHLRTGEVAPYRDPYRESRDPELIRLRDDVELAADDVAMNES